MQRWTYRTILSGLALVAAFILGSCGGSTTDPGTAPGNTTSTSEMPNDGTTMETPMMDETPTP